MNKHWTQKMFIETPSLFGITLEKAIERAAIEVTGLEEIFSKFGVSRDGVVLDICCGIGRHSVVLAERGYSVVGVDISPDYIAHAKKNAAEKNVGGKVEFRVGDMRQIRDVLRDYREKFNAIINLYTSIGYYDEKTDCDVLTQLLELTAAEGVLVIDTKNRDSLIRYFNPRDISQVSNEILLIEERSLNLENSRMVSTWKYYRKEGENLKHLDTINVDHRVYSLHELKEIAEKSGWAYQTCYGSFSLDSFTMNSNRMILVAKKP